MNITAIILHYWKERTDQVHRLVRDLWVGTVVPDTVIVFNNNPEVVLEPVGKEIVVNSSYNFHCLIRHALGLSIKTDCCLFIDDDISVTELTLECLLDYHQVRPEAILGFFGLTLGTDLEHPYTSGEEIQYVKGPRRADIIKGRIHFCKTDKLLNTFKLLKKIPNLSIVWTDDILLSLSNLIFDKAENVVLPPEMRELSEMGVGYHYTEPHYPIRDETCKRVIEMAELWD